jgi:hypothetical protein
MTGRNASKQAKNYKLKNTIMTIYEIKEKTAKTAPYFFTTKTLKFFGQTMSKFRIKKQADGRIKISQPMTDRCEGRIVGETIRYFNPVTNELERE